MDGQQASRTAAVAVVLVMLAAGCSGAPPAATPATSAPPSAPPLALECDAQAFPCAFSDVPEDVRVETERLVAETGSRIAAGATNDDLVAWLRSQPLVAEVEGDADAIRFRPAGGRGVWIARSGDTAAAGALSPGAIAHVGSWEPGRVEPSSNETVTGAGRSERRALVLSPYKWDFGVSDDGQAVAARLRQLPEYANGVTYAENAAVSSSEVSVDDFLGWRDHQVVHVVSHGFRLCRAGKCRAVLAASALPGAFGNVWASGVRGLELEVAVDAAEGAAVPRYHTLVGADFFRDAYRGGLADTVVFLNGCATFGAGATDLAEAIRGSTGVVLGWSQTVETDAAHAAASALYEELAGGGRTVGDAVQRLGDLATNEYQNAAGQPVVATLSSTGRAAGGDLRIRDVVTFEDATAALPLAEGAAVELIGEPGDGAPDSVRWRLRVDGIEPALASAVVQVTIDGHAGAPVAVSAGSLAGTDSWQLGGTLELGVDVNTPHPASFEASLELPEGGLSGDIVAAVLVGESEPTAPSEPAMGSTWRGEAMHRHEILGEGVSTVAQAELIFTLDPRTDGLPIFDYRLSGGTMTFSVSGTRADGCSYLLAPTEIAITPDLAASSGGFVIDARNSPPTYYGFVHISGPVVEVMQTCPDPYAYLTGPFSTRATGTFVDVSSMEPLPVAGDRIFGASSDGNQTFDIARAD